MTDYMHFADISTNGLSVGNLTIRNKELSTINITFSDGTRMTSLTDATGQKGETGAKGEKGAPSTKEGPKGEAGTNGAKGVKGEVGAQGATGNFGGATFDYTQKGNPGSVPHQTSLTNGTVFIGGSADRQREAAYVQISVNNDDGVSVNNFINSIDSVTGTIKGHLRISKKGDYSKFLMFSINTIGDNSESGSASWVLNVTNLSYSSDSPFSDDDDVLLSFAMVGTTGAKGAQGDKGAKGETGEKGATGIQGEQGTKGEVGVQGEQGTKGEVGVQGEKGQKGEKKDKKEKLVSLAQKEIKEK
jgi:hypothetical protein